MNYRTFRTRVNHNTKVLKEALDNNESLVSILPKLYTWTSKPGELHSSVILRNGWDLLPAAYLGLLVNVNINGTDAYEVKKDGTIIDNELKTAEVKNSILWKSGRGNRLYRGSNIKPSHRIVVTSTIAAKYNLFNKKNTETKNMNTFLLVGDTDGADGYFAAYQLSGEAIMNRLRQKKNKPTHIKLCVFMKEGEVAKTVVPLEGFNIWQERIRKHAPIKQPGEF